MSVKKAGLVARTGSKQHSKWTFWSFALEGEKGVYYRTGSQSLGIQKGQYVEFEYDEVENNGYTNLNVNPKSLKITEAQQAASPKEHEAAPAASYSKGKVLSKDDYWNRKEDRDVDKDRLVSYQAATNTALSVVSKAIDLGFLKIPAPKSAKDVAPFDAFTALVDDEAERIYRVYQNIPGRYEEIMEVALEGDDGSFRFDTAASAGGGPELGDD